MNSYVEREWIFNMSSNNIVTEDVTEYFRTLNDSETETVLKSIYDRVPSTSKKAIINKLLLVVLLKGSKQKKIILQECTASQFWAIMKGMASAVISPFSGFDAVSNAINYLREEGDALRIGGYYSSEDNYVRIVINNFGGVINDPEMFLYIVQHELYHYSAANKPYIFRSLFNPILMRFYTALFSYFQNLVGNTGVDLKKAEACADIFVSHMLACERLNTKKKITDDERINKTINNVYNKMYAVDKRIADVWVTFLEDAYIGSRRYSDLIYTCLATAYDSSGFAIPELFRYFQELLFPSEVICIMSYVAIDKPEFIDMIKKVF